MKYCNICNSDQYKILYRDNYVYVICKKCGHVFQTDRKEASHYHELPYESQWGDYMNHSKNRANYIIEFLSTEPLEKIKKIIDIGCGPGGTLHYINHVFPMWEVSGITAPCDKDRMIEGIKAIYSDFENYSFKDKYDLAILCHQFQKFFFQLVCICSID